MSRFGKHLNETVSVNGTTYPKKDVDTFMVFWEKVKKECKPYLKEIKDRRNRDGNLMMRGAKLSSSLETKVTRKNRRPSDTPEEWHKAFDVVFKKKFGWNARSDGLFCTGDYTVARRYGTNVYYVFPIGKYKYLWSDSISDLYSNVDESGSSLNPDKEMLEEWKREYEEEYREGHGEGVWFYEGIGYRVDRTADTRDEAVEMVHDILMAEQRKEFDELTEFIEEPDDYEYEIELWRGGLEDIKTRHDELETEIDNSFYQIKAMLDWEADVDLQTFIEKKRFTGEYDATSGMIEAGAEEMVDDGDYTDKNLADAMAHKYGTEIMVNCYSSHLIHRRYKDLLRFVLFDEPNITRDQLMVKFGSK